MNIKELFDNAEDGTLTYEQFSQAAKDAKAKFTDLSEGKYVAKQKYEDDLASRDTQISTLNDTIQTRDTDLAKIQKQLEDAGVDSEKLSTLSTSLSDLQSKYDTDTEALQNKLNAQAYEFAVRDFANSKNFTSNAAKRDFISSMINKNLAVENGKILGAEDFVTAYANDNADAFIVDKPEPEAGKDNQQPLPQFVQPTQGKEPSLPEGGFGFNFVGVRPHDK